MLMLESMVRSAQRRRARVRPGLAIVESLGLVATHRVQSLGPLVALLEVPYPRSGERDRERLTIASPAHPAPADRCADLTI